MRKSDKKHKIAKANLLVENRYLQQKKRVITESMYDSKGNFKGGPNPQDEFEPDEREYETKMRNQLGEFVVKYNRSHDDNVVSLIGVFKASSGEPITPKSFNNDENDWNDFMVDAKRAAIDNLADNDTPSI